MAAAESWDFDGLGWIFQPHPEQAKRNEEATDQLQEYRNTLGQQVGCLRALITMKYGAQTAELARLKDTLKNIEAHGRVQRVCLSRRANPARVLQSSTKVCGTPFNIQATPRILQTFDCSPVTIQNCMYGAKGSEMGAHSAFTLFVYLQLSRLKTWKTQFPLKHLSCHLSLSH